MTQPATREAGSYRDPSGFVYRREGRLLRQVNATFTDEWRAFESSGLQAALWDQRLLVRHETVDLDLAAAPGAVAVIEPELIPTLSYPYEWSFSQLKDAALLTLTTQSLAEAHGMTLRDASGFNVQFADGRPILIDTLSFKPMRADAPWEPYRQFCEHFLAPLALMAYRDGRLGLLLSDFLDGIPLDLASTLLPRRTRFSPGLAAHVHLHARAQRGGVGREERATKVTVSATRRQALLDHLRRTVEGLRVRAADTQWADYAGNTSYSPEAAAAKDEAVRAMLAAVGGTDAVDVGANTGRFSAIAAEAGSRVVAVDGDWAATERHYLDVRARKETRVLPLVADIASPSPAVGWGNAERPALLDRLHGDAVLALALVHHLAIGRNVPLPDVASVLARLGRHLVVEWVPKQDPMVQRLLAVREDVFADYTEEGFRAAFEGRFDLVSETPLEGSLRVLFHYQRSSGT